MLSYCQFTCIHFPLELMLFPRHKLHSLALSFYKTIDFVKSSHPYYTGQASHTCHGSQIIWAEHWIKTRYPQNGDHCGFLVCLSCSPRPVLIVHVLHSLALSFYKTIDFVKSSHPYYTGQASHTCHGSQIIWAEHWIKTRYPQNGDHCGFLVCLSCSPRPVLIVHVL